ncbi:MAG: hypothetical protein K2J20_06420, partial [Bacilli bacterium]|nr:hypothetical protein [Bacilli bacterium]
TPANEVKEKIITERVSIDNIFDSLVGYVEKSKTKLEEEQNEYKPATVENIYASLNTANMQETLDLIHKYLEQIGAVKYEFLVVSALKCSILEEDLAFIRPMSLLVSLNRGTFSFELNTYLEIFYAACEAGDVELAQIYLNIIWKAKQIVPNNIDINWLNQTLQTAKNKSEGRK